jgi:hydroxymethylpyrimidine pyrophosphatase-like HAD family hydrolase
MVIGALALDYDGTIADEGVVLPPTVAALERLKASGRRLILVTGRLVDDLDRVFGRLELFAAVVAENGSVLYRPDLGVTRALAPPAPKAFTGSLRRRGVAPLNVGRSTISADRRWAGAFLEALEETSLNWAIIYNKQSLMCLPPGVDKASGLRVALAELGVPADETLGAGDAENDRTFLAECGLSFAPANALADVKAAVDIVSDQSEGGAIQWLADVLLTDGPAGLTPSRRLGGGG